MTKTPPWSWKGAVALILAIAVGLALNIIVLGVILEGGNINESTTTFLSAVLGAIVGAISTYLGTTALSRRRNGNGNGHDDDSE